jgi:hypothetical protein
MEILQLPAFMSFVHRLSFRTACQLFSQLNCLPAVLSTELDRRLFWASLAELNWTGWAELSFMLRPTVRRPVYLGKSTHLGFTTSLLLSDSCGFVDVGRSLWREDGSVFYNCCGLSPAQSFSGPSPVGLSQIRDFPSSPPSTRRASAEVFDPATTRD